nr:hypothetical protein [uncultured Blautia sp.]
MTKGDNIRRMLETDEGIADFLMEHGIENIISFCRCKPECNIWLDTEKEGIPEEWCKQCLIEWLEENHVENKD